MVRTIYLTASLILAVSCWSTSIGADSWPGAQIKEVFSTSREWFVRVTPGKSLGDTVGFAGSAKGPYARAEFFRRDASRGYRLVASQTLVNPIAPVLFLVTDRGYLVTLDNWHNMGYGRALAGYAPDGKQLFALQLGDLFSPEEIRAFRTSVSSIWWRTDTVYVRDGQKSIYIAMDDKGTEVILEPETGRWQQCAWRGTAHLCRDRNDGREWRPYHREPPLRP